jgi:hypothetical protein
MKLAFKCIYFISLLLIKYYYSREMLKKLLQCVYTKCIKCPSHLPVVMKFMKG